MPHRHCPEKKQLRTAQYRNSRRAGRQIGEDSTNAIIDSSSTSTTCSEDGGASRSPTKQRRSSADDAVTVKPMWLRALPSPARNDTTAADSDAQTAPLKSYRELLQARGKDVIRCSRQTPKAASVSKSGGACFFGAASELGDTEPTSPEARSKGSSQSTSAGSSPPGSPVLPVKTPSMGAAPTSPYNFAPTCGSMGSFGMLPVGMMGMGQPMLPQTSPHELMMAPSSFQPSAAVPLQLMDVLPPSCPVNGLETSSMQCSTYDMMMMSGLMPDGHHVVSMEESRRPHVSSMDEMMLTLLPDGGPLLDMEELAAQLRAAAPCRYDD